VRRGTVVLTPFPFTDLTGAKVRPAVVISRTDRPGDDVILAFVSSVVPPPPLPTDLVVHPSHPDFRIGPAKREGLLAVQRLFALDSESLEAGLPTVEKAAPDAVEMLPSVILPTIAGQLARRGTLPPLIAGGLIRTAAQVDAVLSAGAVAVSTSETSLWGYSRSADQGRR